MLGEVRAPHYLVYVKLLAHRRQDLADIAAMLAAESVDLDRAGELFARGAPELLADLDALVAEMDGPRSP